MGEGGKADKSHGNQQRFETEVKNRGVVYQVPCAKCDSVYIGQTKRPLGRRLAEHRLAVKKNDQSNGIALHKEKTKHSPNFREAKVLYREKNLGTRLQLEAYTIEATNGKNHNIVNQNQIMKEWCKFQKRMFGVKSENIKNSGSKTEKHDGEAKSLPVC